MKGNSVNPKLLQDLIALIFVLLSSCSSHFLGTEKPRRSLADVKHIVVIYLENRSFDHLYGLFPGAIGISDAKPEHYIQIDHDGKPFDRLPPIWKDKQNEQVISGQLPNKPFRLDSPELNLPASGVTRDLVHRFYQNIEQINGGSNNKFAAISDAGGLVMGHYGGANLPLWQWAQDYVLADNFFMAAYGGSYLNHQWLICACTPEHKSAPQNLRAQVLPNANGTLQRKPESPASAMQGPPKFFDGAVTPDGYSVNTEQPPYQPSGIAPAEHGDVRYADVAQHPLPPQTTKTIGDTLSDKGISWVWYASGWNSALIDSQRIPKTNRQVIYTGKPGTINFQPHHQPFNYYQRFAPGTPDRDWHLKDGDDFLAAIDQGKLPQVAFYKPAGYFNEHPGYTDVLSSEQHINTILERIRDSPLWPSTVIIVTYDENGGFWDHVAPPAGDRWGPGTRVPALIISSLAKRGFVDHSLYDTTSIIKLITRRFDLEPLPGVRPFAGDLTNTLAIEP